MEAVAMDGGEALTRNKKETACFKSGEWGYSHSPICSNTGRATHTHQSTRYRQQPLTSPQIARCQYRLLVQPARHCHL